MPSKTKITLAPENVVRVMRSKIGEAGFTEFLCVTTVGNMKTLLGLTEEDWERACVNLQCGHRMAIAYPKLRPGEMYWIAHEDVLVVVPIIRSIEAARQASLAALIDGE